MKRLFIDGVTKRSRKISEVNPRVSIDLEQYVRQVIAAVGGGSGSNYIFENGLTELSGVVRLGGLLNGYADIDGDLGTQSVRFLDMQTFSASTNNPSTNYTCDLFLNNSSPTNYPLNGLSNVGLSINNKNNNYGAGYFLTEDGIDPRPYIVSEMSYGGGAARTAKIEFSNDYILNSHKIYDVSNPSGTYREYAIRYGDSQLTMYSVNADSSNPLDLASNIINSIEVSPNGIMIESSSTTGTPTFNYTFPITSSTKPAPAQGHSIVLNSTSTQFDFVKDYKSLNHCFFNVGETVVIKTVRIPVMFNKYILESVTVCEPVGGGTITLKITKGVQNQSIVVNANNGVTNYLLGSITTLISAPEFVTIELNTPSNPTMTQLSVTLNFLYAG